MGRAELVEPAHGAVAPLYSPMILFQHVVLVLAGAMRHVVAEFLRDGLGITGVAIGRDLLEYARRARSSLIQIKEQALFVA